jgi:uncharacterized protein YjbI with pentapeptide repeats
MKTISKILLLIFVLPLAGIAQKTITAESIIKSINNHDAVSLSNMQVTGDLDLTKLDNMKQEQQQQNPSDKIFISTVTSPISFINCSFKGKVLGYFNPNSEKSYVKSSTVYNTNFNADVNFENCTFEKEVSFKYSVFGAKASFVKSHFNDEAFFKYAKFEEGPKFAEALFKNDAIFKYVEFPAGFDFSNAVFESGADFKYAKLTDGGSFANAEFRNGSNFKYAGFSKSVTLKGANFNGSNDFKYTTLDNQQTSLNELMSK